MGFDIARSPGVSNVPGQGCEDFTHIDGFQNALKLVMRLRPGGLLAMAPDCSSFGFGPSSLTLRTSMNFAGDESHEFVRQGNLMAHTAAFFLCLAILREVEAFMENPSGSTIFSFLDGTLKLFRSPGVEPLYTFYGDRCAYLSNEERATQNYKKHYKFLSTGRWIQKAMKLCSCGSVPHEPLMDVDESGRRTGRREHMKRSGQYPPALGQAIVLAWKSGSNTPWRPRRRADKAAREPASNEALDNESSGNETPLETKKRRTISGCGEPVQVSRRPGASGLMDEDPWADMDREQDNGLGDHCESGPLGSPEDPWEQPWLEPASPLEDPWAETSNVDVKGSTDQDNDDADEDPWC